MRLHLIVGARPNFIKIAPIIHAIHAAQEIGANISYRLVHTGQHFDKKMSDSFFHELNIPNPDSNLGCGGGTQAEQTAAIMVAYEKDLVLNPADLVIVVGDVTSTMACSIVAKKMNTKVAHVEAGIRSFDLTMPEEINRMVTDSITDYFFTTSETANNNLRKAGIAEKCIFFVGNVMIDTLLENISRFKRPEIWKKENLKKGNYLIMTLHRPNNVDEEQKFKSLIETIIINSRNLPIIFPVHPRTLKIIQKIKLNSQSSQFKFENLRLIEPLGYLEFNYLVKNAKVVITDSGGITEETTVMGVPCITLRDNTERPETVTMGTNEVIGTNPEGIAPMLKKLFEGKWKKGKIPPLWDGKTARRIVNAVYNEFS
jgi:UDP-N-acetylglucosamine 2-epimerase (non-hydrolysing)